MDRQENIDNQEFYYDYSILPHTIIQQIFTNLSANDLKNCLQTCKTWYYVSLHPKLTQPREFSLDENNITVVSLMNRKYRKVKLNYLNFTKHNVHYLKYFKTFGEHIEQLTIHKCSIEMNQIIIIFKYLNNLTWLEIDDCNNIFNSKALFSNKINSNDRATILTNLSNIKGLRITSKTMNYDTLEKFLLITTSLEYLDFSILNSNSKFNKNFEKFVKLLALVDTTKLKNLVISIEKREEIYLEQFEEVETSNIKSLKLKLDGILDDNYTWDIFCKKFSGLEEFNINDCNSIEDYSTSISRYITEYMVNLKRLYTTNIRSLFETLFRLEHLEVLHIATLREVDNYRREWLENFINVDLIFVQLLPTLKSFCFDYTIREVTLEKLAEFCPNLENLELNVVDTLNCESIFKYLTKLKKLRLIFAPWIIQEIFKYLDLKDIKYCLQTCKSWYEATCRQKFIDQLEFFLDENNINIVDIMKRKYRKVKLNYLNFTNHSVLYLRYFKNFGEHIDELKIHKCRIGINQLMIIFIYLNNLSCLEIDDDSNIFNSLRIFSGKHDRFTIENNLNKIKILRLTSKLMNYEMLLKFMSLLPNLEHLEFTMLSNNKCNNNFEKFMNILPNIETTKLKNLAISIDDEETIMFDHFDAVDTSNIKSLKLKLNASHRRYNDMVRIFCKKFAGLDEFNIHCIYPVYSEVDRTQMDFPFYISRYMPNVKRLYLTQIVSRFELVSPLEHLEILHITITPFRSGAAEGFQNCDRIFINIMPNLKHFVFDGKTSDETLVKLTGCCPNLEHLELKSVLAIANCELIFKNLLKLKKLRLIFGQAVFDNMKNADNIEIPVYTISRLVNLEEFYTNLMIPSITEAELKNLPLLNKVVTPIFSMDNNKQIHKFNTKFI